MPDDQGWIRTRVSQAGAEYPLLTEPVRTRIEDLLRGPFSERRHTRGELEKIAKELLAGMAPEPSKDQGPK